MELICQNKMLVRQHLSTLWPFLHFRNNWKECGPANLFAIGKEKLSDNWIDKANNVKEFYIGDEEMNIDKHFMNITDMLSDAMFTYGTDYTVRYAIITIQSIDYRKYLTFLDFKCPIYS